jgi:hypothetical protein
MVSFTKHDIELALDRIDKEGVPARNRSTGYCLIDRGKRHYPPKYVLRVAHHLKTGEMPKGLRGGHRVNNQLIALGYEVSKHECRNDNLHITN